MKRLKDLCPDGQKQTLLVPVTIYADEAVKLEHVSVVFTTPQGNVLIRQSGKVKLEGEICLDVQSD